jgi:uncharacterized peroxidase-related enzyme
MAWVSEIPEGQAAGQLRTLYDQLRAHGEVYEFYRVQGQTPATVAAELGLVGAILADGALTRSQKEQILVVVSGLNTSSYCVALHMDVLRAFGMERKLARTLAVDYPHAQVDPRMQPIFRLADKLTRNPETVEKSDVDAVLAAGWNEAALREALQTIALANFVNRISIGFGLMADY